MLIRGSVHLFLLCCGPVREQTLEMPLRLLNKWPKSFGFEIYGNGPSYVVSVQKGSMADKSGLRPGDQLLELNGRDVTAMSQHQIRALAKPRAFKPPDIKVVSCLQTMEIAPELPVGYGFSVVGENPVTVGSVEYGGSAFRAGLRIGEIIYQDNDGYGAISRGFA